MSVRVQDYKGNEIKVGTHVMYGERYRAGITFISEPDIDDSDERHVKYGLYITLQFVSGGVDRLWCPIANAHEARMNHTYGPPMADVLEVFEEPGDLEVIT